MHGAPRLALLRAWNIPVSCCGTVSRMLTASTCMRWPSAQSIRDLPLLQDAPPPGGFPSIRIERRLPNTGPTGVAIFAVMGCVVGYGFYKVSRNTRHRAAQRAMHDQRC
jgi:hypothetical protein